MPNKPIYKGIFASSTDPTGQTLSLTVSSGIQMVIGIGVTIAVIRGVDPAIASTNATTIAAQAQNIVTQYLAVLPALYSAYHSIQFLWGFARKWFPTVPALPNLPGQPAGSTTVLAQQ